MEMDEMMDTALAGHCRNLLVWDPSKMAAVDLFNQKIEGPADVGNLQSNPGRIIPVHKDDEIAIKHSKFGT